MNPSSLLLARTPPVASTSTYSTHIPSARPADHIFPSSSSLSSPPNNSATSPSPTPPPTAALSNLHPTFTPDAPGPCTGTIEIVVEATTFLVHKEVIVFASSFFETILSGEWAETSVYDNQLSITAHRPTNPSKRPSISRSQTLDNNGLPAHPQLKQSTDLSHLHDPRTIGPPAHSSLTSQDLTPSPLLPPLDTELLTSAQLSDINLTTDPLTSGSSQGTSDIEEEKYQTLQTCKQATFFTPPPPPPSTSPNKDGQNKSARRVDARIVLYEEKAAPFQDLLMFVYPHLECVCTWNNAPELMTMSSKFDMPFLKRHVLNFLLSSAAGKPIQAMKIAEDHQLSELYRESSRFLLDNWQGWDPKELDILTSETLLKLEKRRTWFLERLLKLGLVNSSRDYVCPPTCPDPQHCAKLVDDKWRSAWAASFKFGPPQPSSVYRALRCLEPSLHSPSLLLPHTSCQQHAIRFFADLFDRMFSQFPARVAVAHHSHSNSFHHLQQQQQQQPQPPHDLAPSVSVSSPLVKASRHAKYFLAVELFDPGSKDNRERK